MVQSHTMTELDQSSMHDASQTSLAAAAVKPMTLLIDGCRLLDLPLNQTQIEQFVTYYHLLAAWNSRINLTAITEFEDVQVKHFLDSLVSLPLIAEELNASLPLDRPLRLVDVGTGAGFPGLPLKIVCPGLELTLIDGTQKKIAYLEALTRELGLADVHLVHGRAEELGLKPEHREQYDLVVARAVAPLDTLAEYLLPLVAPGGLAVMYKGPSAPQEFMAARGALTILGGEAVRLAPVVIPNLPERRFILLVKKVQKTPKAYPRGQGLARKRPLR